MEPELPYARPTVALSERPVPNDAINHGFIDDLVGQIAYPIKVYRGDGLIMREPRLYEYRGSGQRTRLGV